MTIDTIDRRILDELQRDGAQSAADVASKLGMSNTTCWRRIQQLEKDAVNEVANLSMLDELSFQVLLEPGDLLLLSNYSVFHNRDAFEDWAEPERKRLLLRKWINIHNARELTWEFADHYNTGPRQGPYVERQAERIAKVA